MRCCRWRCSSRCSTLVSCFFWWSFPVIGTPPHIIASLQPAGGSGAAIPATGRSLLPAWLASFAPPHHNLRCRKFPFQKVHHCCPGQTPCYLRARAAASIRVRATAVQQHARERAGRAIPLPRSRAARDTGMARIPHGADITRCGQRTVCAAGASNPKSAGEPLRNHGTRAGAARRRAPPAGRHPAASPGVTRSHDEAVHV